MSTTTLFTGAAAMVILGLAVNFESFIAVGTGLMWLGLSIKANHD